MYVRMYVCVYAYARQLSESTYYCDHLHRSDHPALLWWRPIIRRLVQGMPRHRLLSILKTMLIFMCMCIFVIEVT